MCDILSGYYHNKKIATNSTEIELKAVLGQQKPLYQITTETFVSAYEECVSCSIETSH